MVGSEPPTVVGDVDDQPEIPEARIMISIFLGLLILTVFVMPSVGFGEHHEQRYRTIVSCVLFCSGVSIAWRRRGLLLSSALIVLVAISAQLRALWTPTHYWILCSETATLAATLIISWTLLLQIFRSKGPITSVSLQAAIAVYLLFGTAWANAYIIAMQQNPHSFQSTIALSSSSSEEWMYYSFVTLTTLGYGEITPKSQVARSLAIGEALVGQLYLAILIARLVGKEMSSGRKIDVRSLIAGERKKQN
jgi:voltage-gated potassium channel